MARSLPPDAKVAMNEPSPAPEERHAYRSEHIDELRRRGHAHHFGRVEVRLARKFGFCWGVDRAVAMVWEAIRKHPDRQIWLLNQIIHNPKVNEDFLERGVRFIFGRYAEEGGFDRVRPEDLVVIPAFSAEVPHLNRLERIGCEIVDTTCPWVEKPHRRVSKYVEDGFTVLIHGILRHDETRSTCSLVDSKSGHYLVVRDLEETDRLCRFLEGEGSPQDFLQHFRTACSRGFDPDLHLQRIGIINQTTMLASESREVARRVTSAIRARDGEVRSKETFRDFDTICPATQDNQDAVLSLSLEDAPDLFIVLGGYDSSNTRNLLRAANARAGKYHIQEPGSVERDRIRHRDPETGFERTTENWVPDGEFVVALTAGASTPDTELAEVVRRLCRAADVEFDLEIAGSDPVPSS